MTPEHRAATKAALFQGRIDSYDYWAWDVMASRDGYIGWAFEEAAETKLLVGTEEATDFRDLSRVEATVARAYARVHGVSEESWLKMMERSKM
jgi:hypothetical protein